MNRFGAYPSDDNMIDNDINSYFGESDTNFFADNSNDSFFCDSFYNDSSSMGEFFTEAGIGTDPKEKNFSDDKYYRDSVDKIDHTPGVTPGYRDYVDSMREHDQAIQRDHDKLGKAIRDESGDDYKRIHRHAMAHNDRASELRERSEHQFHTPRHYKRDPTKSKGWNPGSDELEDKAQYTFRKANAHARASESARDEDHKKAHRDTARDLYTSGVGIKRDALRAKKREDDIWDGGNDNRK